MPPLLFPSTIHRNHGSCTSVAIMRFENVVVARMVLAVVARVVVVYDEK